MEHKRFQLKLKTGIIIALFVPFWLIIGRGLLGAGGWMTLGFIVTAPFVAGILLLLVMLSDRLKGDLGNDEYIRPLDSAVLLLLYGLFFLIGFFVVDGGDTSESFNSVANKISGGSITLAVSESMFQALSNVAVILISISFIVIIGRRVRRRFSNNSSNPRTSI